MHRLPQDQVDAFEEHYFVCADCATMLQRVTAYVDAMRVASQTLRSGAPRRTALGSEQASD